VSDPRLDYFLPADERGTDSQALEKLELRKAALEAAIADRFRAARRAGTMANVTALSATLREVKEQIAATRANGGKVEPGTCAVCGSDSWRSGRYVKGKTICGRCLGRHPPGQHRKPAVEDE
jgi:hypothetical protein